MYIFVVIRTLIFVLFTNIFFANEVYFYKIKNVNLKVFKLFFIENLQISKPTI